MIQGALASGGLQNALSILLTITPPLIVAFSQVVYWLGIVLKFVFDNKAAFTAFGIVAAAVSIVIGVTLVAALALLASVGGSRDCACCDLRANHRPDRPDRELGCGHELAEWRVEQLYHRHRERMEWADNLGIPAPSAVFVNAIMGGITSRIPFLNGEMQNMMAQLKSWLPHSPAKQGPLMRLNEYGPLVKGFAQGIDDSAGILNVSMSHLVAPASGLGSPAVPSSSANTYALAMSNGNGQPIIVHVHNYNQIDGHEMTDVILSHAVSQVRSNGPVLRVA